MNDAVMLLVVLEDGKLLMHLRDNKAEILHPGCWAGFGGAVEAGESPEDALRREVFEEIGVRLKSATLIDVVTDEIDEGGRGDRVRMYVSRGEISPEDVHLAEGAGVAAFSLDELRFMNVSPFVKRTLEAHTGIIMAG